MFALCTEMHLAFLFLCTFFVSISTETTHNKQWQRNKSHSFSPYNDDDDRDDSDASHQCNESYSKGLPLTKQQQQQRFNNLFTLCSI